MPWYKNASQSSTDSKMNNKFCKAHNTQNNDKGVKINPFTQIYPMRYAVIQLINFYTCY